MKKIPRFEVVPVVEVLKRVAEFEQIESAEANLDRLACSPQQEPGPIKRKEGEDR